MRINLTYIALPIIIGITIVAMLMYIFRGDRSKAIFANYQELEQSGYIEKGWLPVFLPKSATNILETHDLDSNEVQALFRYSPPDRKSVEQECEQKNILEKGVEYRCLIRDRSIIIRLMDNGEGYLFSSSLNEHHE